MSIMQRVGGGTVALALMAPVAIVSGYAVVTNFPQVSQIAPLHMVLPPDNTVVACPGPVRTLSQEVTAAGNQVAYDPQFAPIDNASKLSTAFLTVSANSNILSGTDQRNTTFAATSKPQILAQSLAGETGASLRNLQPVANTTDSGIGLGGLSVEDSQQPVSITSQATVLGSPAMTAFQTTVTTTGDLRSAALATCSLPQLETYLVGGRTDIGSSSRLVLTNTSTRAASVSFDVWDQQGAVPLGTLASVTVPAGSQRAILLEGASRTAGSLGVRVNSNVPVNAAIQTNTMSGLVPMGLEMINPATAPDVKQSIPAVSVGASAEGAANSRVDIMVPGGTPGAVTVTALGLNGVTKTYENMPVTGATVTQIQLTDLPQGEYTLSITGDVPFTAAARSTRAGTKNADLLGTVTAPEDVAWSPASAPLIGPAVVPLPDVGGTWQVDVGTVSQATSVTVIAIDNSGNVGVPVRINLAANSTAPIGVQALAASGIAQPMGMVVVPDLPGTVVAGTVLSVQAPDGELIASAPLRGEQYTQIATDLRVNTR